MTHRNRFHKTQPLGKNCECNLLFAGLDDNGESIHIRSQQMCTKVDRQFSVKSHADVAWKYILFKVPVRDVHSLQHFYFNNIALA